MTHTPRLGHTIGFSKICAALLSYFVIQFVLSSQAWAKLGASDVEAPDDANAANGATVTYVLPADGTLPRTYLVTLAIVDPKNRDWIVSTFVAGSPRTVTNENKGRFTETWNGLDENFMPVPPGDYAVKGIYMPAKKWGIDEEWHAVTPKYAGGLSAWHPRPDQPNPKEPFGGDPITRPLRDVSVSKNGTAAFYYQYMENGTQCPLVDLNKPVGPEQLIRTFDSHLGAGGTSAATDGKTVWAFETVSAFVYRTDGKSFGSTPMSASRNAYSPDGWVTAIAAGKGAEATKTYVYIAQRGKVIRSETRPRMTQSNTDFVDTITIHDGDNGKILATLPVPRPQAVCVEGDTLYVLSGVDKARSIMRLKLKGGLPAAGAAWGLVFAVPATITPFDLETDSRGRFYLSDPAANKVYQLDAGGRVLRAFGKLSAQKPGTYDPDTLMSPEKLAVWTDGQGKDRLIVVEMGGPNRASEWNTETGALIREIQSYQTFANNLGWCIDPEHPEDLYIYGQKEYLLRFKIDYATGTFRTDAVWPIGTDPRIPQMQPREGIPFGNMSMVRAQGQLFLADRQMIMLYRLTQDSCLPAAGVIREGTNQDAKLWMQGKKIWLWHDANANGRVDDAELTPTQAPGRVFTYFGENWVEGPCYLAVNALGRDVWRLAPASFDPHGNPVFKEWKKVLTDPVFEARSAGSADPVHGENEMANAYDYSWHRADGSDKEGFYVQARGSGFDANYASQNKVSYYAPQADGSFQLKWRVGRSALRWTARRGEIYGAMRVCRPINGLVTVIDQTRCGLLLYTQDGMYVDTLFPDERRMPKSKTGLYSLPGEFFSGTMFPNIVNGKIYFGAGKMTPMIFEMEGWSLKENPVKSLTTVQEKVTLTSAQMSAPPEIALTLRGGAGQARVARFSPALGGASLDGSMTGWEAGSPVRFKAAADQSVDLLCLYDPDHLYLRWHARLSAVFEPRPLPDLPHIFSHEILADTLSLYLQGDPSAKPGGDANGRPGDVRFVFGIFKKDGKVEPVGIGMYPTWTGKSPANPQVYRTHQTATFAHVGAIEGARYGHSIDADGKGFVLAVAIPRAAIPALQKPLDGSLQTMGNFSATLGGHNKFWWANTDGKASSADYDEPTEAKLYPGSWAPVFFEGVGEGITVQNWLKCGPFGGIPVKEFIPQHALPPERLKQIQSFFDLVTYPPDDGKVDLDAVFKGDMVQGWWKNPGPVKWKPAVLADQDTRITMGANEGKLPAAYQCWYGVTWIHAPASTELEVEFQGHKMTNLRWVLNGQVIDVGKYVEKKPIYVRMVATKRVTLRAGWNQIMFRGYSFGYAPFGAGLIVKGSPEKLWPLKFSAQPPKAGT